MENLGQLDGLREQNNGDLNLTNQELILRILRLRERAPQQNSEQGDGSDGQNRFNLVMQCPHCLRHNEEKKLSQMKWVLSLPSVPDKL